MIKLSLNIDTAIYGSYESAIKDTKLFLNSSFIVDEVTINNQTTVCTVLNTGKYQIIELPIIKGTVKVNYHGKVDSRNGLYPYVIEDTDDEFYILRSESMYYPWFYENGSVEFLNHYLYPQIDDEFLVSIKINDDRKIISNLDYKGDNLYQGYNPVFAVGEYIQQKAYFGEIYHLKGHFDIEAKISFIKNVNDFLLRYKNVLLNNLKIVVIPENYGSFVLPNANTMFITDSSFDNPEFLIHELIHLHWNPRCNVDVQKSRFFDEGITQYLTLRVMDELNIKTSNQTQREFTLAFNELVYQYDFDVMPIVKFAEFDYGELSYYLGPLAILQIEKKIGKESFDKAFKEMFIKNEIYDFNKFKLLFDNIDDVWERCFETSQFFNELMYGKN